MLRAMNNAENYFNSESIKTDGLNSHYPDEPSEIHNFFSKKHQNIIKKNQNK